jgi:DNA-binding transcriptional MerR regulator
MAVRQHVSIGEVLNELRDEFPDITISKIRFLESQGLVEPERTPSGYRKFYVADIERLRFILREQKDNFLPLKVIKERLDEIDRNGGFTPAAPTEPEPPVTPEKEPKRRSKKAPAREPALFEETRRAREEAEVREVVSGVLENDTGPDDLAASPSGVSLTRTELARAAEISDEQLGQLEEYGLVLPAHTAKDRVLFDEDALAVARVAGAFMRHGIEARHLRMYRAFADREAGLFEQILLPYRRQRNPEAQARTAQTLGELSGLGRQLRTAFLRQAVRRTLGS